MAGLVAALRVLAMVLTAGSLPVIDITQVELFVEPLGCSLAVVAWQPPLSTTATVHVHVKGGSAL